jgi:DNA-binding response OmpR family regulator
MERITGMSGGTGRTTREIAVVVVTPHLEQEWALGPGHQVMCMSADTVAQVRTPDVYLVDVVDAPQLSLVRRLAIGGSQAVVVFGAAGHADAMHYLDAGAADYVSPRTSQEERIARIRAAARRNSVRPDDDGENFVIGDVAISLTRHEVRRGGELVPLTPHEFELLAALLQTPDVIVPHHKLMVRVWGVENSSSRHYLRIYVRQLGKKLEPDHAEPTLIVTEWGRGYAIHTGAAVDSDAAISPGNKTRSTTSGLREAS